MPPQPPRHSRVIDAILVVLLVLTLALNLYQAISKRWGPSPGPETAAGSRRHIR